MSDSIFYLPLGIAIYLTMILGTLIGTIIALTAIDSMWGLLLFLAWPPIAAGIVMFALWWGEL